MELDLDLSLSPFTNSSKLGFDFDLNKQVIEGVTSCLDTEKVRFESTFGFGNIKEDCYVAKPRLFSLSDQPNEEDEDPLESDSSVIDDEKEISEVVGWPPIKPCMRKYHNYRHYNRNHPYHHHVRRIMNNNMSNPMTTIERVRSLSSSSSTSTTSSMYVKVKMDGVALTRKVDIKLFNSYESLTNSLITMFSQYEGYDREGTNYKLTFIGRDGDWLLPGNVPWKIFAESVHRISIIRDRPCVYTRLWF